MQYQETSQVNYVDSSVLYTRVIEHKLLNQQTSNITTVSFEYPQLDGEPFYPVPTEENKNKYLKYKSEADKRKSTFFCGRLAEYQYYNMDQVVASTLINFENLHK